MLVCLRCLTFHDFSAEGGGSICLQLADEGGPGPSLYTPEDEVCRSEEDKRRTYLDQEMECKELGGEERQWKLEVHSDGRSLRASNTIPRWHHNRATGSLTRSPVDDPTRRAAFDRVVTAGSESAMACSLHAVGLMRWTCETSPPHRFLYFVPTDLSGRLGRATPAVAQASSLTQGCTEADDYGASNL